MKNITITRTLTAYDFQIKRRARQILRHLAFALTPEEEKRCSRLVEDELKEAVRQALDEKLGRARRVF